MALSNIQTSQLRKIAATHDNDPANPDISKFALVKPKQVSALTKAGYVQVNTGVQPNENGEQPARATATGIAYIQQAPATSTAALKPTFTLVSNVAIPEAKRGNPGNGGRSLYPFDEMHSNNAFFVAAGDGEDEKDVAKKLASVVSAANKRYIEKSRPKTQADGVTPILVRGKPAMEHLYTKHFVVRPVKDAAATGFQGVTGAGAGVWCDGENVTK